MRRSSTPWPTATIRSAATRSVILLFSDRIEFYSPGRLPGHVTVDNLVDERFSRNEAIVQVLADMGFIERLGYGIDRMIRLMAEAKLPEPRFEETAAGFRVTLSGPRRQSVRVRFLEPGVGAN